jgi:hypothetical protein
MEWLRHAPTTPTNGEARTPLPLLRLRHLLNVVDQHPAVRDQVHGVLSAFWRDVDAAALFADFGFGTRLSLRSDVLARIRRRVLPGTPETTDLAELFQLLFEPEDAGWLAAMDAATLSRVAALLATPEAAWRASLLEAITILASAVHASGYAPGAAPAHGPRPAGDRALPPDHAVQQRAAARAGRRHARRGAAAAMLFRTVLDGCRRPPPAWRPPGSLRRVGRHRLRSRPAGRPHAPHRTAAGLRAGPAAAARTAAPAARTGARGRPAAQHPRSVLARHYSLLARQVAERNAETGTHYITRDRAEYRQMLRAPPAAARSSPAPPSSSSRSWRWGSARSGAASGPAPTTRQLRHRHAAALDGGDQAAGHDRPCAGRQPAPRRGQRRSHARRLRRPRDAAHPLAGGRHRRQPAACVPLVLAVQWLAIGVFGVPLVGKAHGEYVLHSITLLGPTAPVRGLHRRAAVRQFADRRLGRELVRLPPPGQRHRLEPAHRGAAGRGARAALGQPGGAPTCRAWPPTCRWA